MTPGKFLIEERAIAVIPVPQALPELLAKNAAADAAPSLLLVGDVDYGGDPGMLLASNRGQRAVRDGAMTWGPLPGTRAEILAIRDSFEQKFSDGTDKQLRKQQATAEAVREAAPKYRYLHFATHGFFADPKIRSALAPSDKPESSIDRGAMLQQATGEHPGLLSGIVLTGANQPPVDGKGDGILTALEVGELDLWGVESGDAIGLRIGLGKNSRRRRRAGVAAGVSDRRSADDRDVAVEDSRRCDAEPDDRLLREPVVEKDVEDRGSASGTTHADARRRQAGNGIASG